MLIARRVSVCLAVLAAAPAVAQLNNLDEAFRTTPITTQQLADNFHVLFGVGGNILVSIGDNGVLIVDDQFPQMVPKYKATIGELGGGAIDFAINTHWHFDHADGGLETRGEKLGEFAIAGGDRKWHWAEARIEGPDVVVVSAPDVTAPEVVRYAWQSNPLATLFNGAGLPAAPFKTDENATPLNP